MFDIDPLCSGLLHATHKNLISVPYRVGDSKDNTRLLDQLYPVHMYLIENDYSQMIICVEAGGRKFASYYSISDRVNDIAFIQRKYNDLIASIKNVEDVKLRWTPSTSITLSIRDTHFGHALMC
jgi:hypothetical protein